MGRGNNGADAVIDEVPAQIECLGLGGGPVVEARQTVTVNIDEGPLSAAERLGCLAGLAVVVGVLRHRLCVGFRTVTPSIVAVCFNPSFPFCHCSNHSTRTHRNGCLFLSVTVVTVVVPVPAVMAVSGIVAVPAMLVRDVVDNRPQYACADAEQSISGVSAVSPGGLVGPEHQQGDIAGGGEDLTVRHGDYRWRVYDDSVVAVSEAVKYFGERVAV